MKWGFIEVALISVITGLIFFVVSYEVVPTIQKTHYEKGASIALAVDSMESQIATTTQPVEEVLHVKTPESVKGLYMTSWVASTPSLYQKIVAIADTTEINTILIDIKDDTGKISYLVSDPNLQKVGSAENRIKDIKGLIKELHSKNIYVIGRVAVFQDPYLAKTWSHDAVQNANGGVWKDRKGISWMDAGSQEVWDYAIAIANDAYSQGFDEINFDYVRFPTDGSGLQALKFPKSGNRPKPEVIKEFFAYLDKHLRGTGLVISADLFGMTTTNKDDLGIGQILENVLPHVDYVGPMVYPSHYPTGWNGYKNPAEHPYDVIKLSMQGAIDKLTTLKNASTTPQEVKDKLDVQQLRPWLQDFNLGADYGPKSVRAQIQATYDIGLKSWILWDAGNTYTVDALNRE